MAKGIDSVIDNAENERHRRMYLSTSNSVTPLYSYGERKFAYILDKVRYDVDHNVLTTTNLKRKAI